MGRALEAALSQAAGHVLPGPLEYALPIQSQHDHVLKQLEYLPRRLLQRHDYWDPSLSGQLAKQLHGAERPPSIQPIGGLVQEHSRHWGANCLRN